ncbi:SDR family oxidoreductase [Streptomyces sp. RFCAC02]|uniref:SDR family oxidoreductase n=1 Tax=Streptomyces sp. RFCAC02 TaxID=2499143 RepID=UPI001021AE89|nr:SDR family oxidoreductase [Streptomyces sp. RFCAC02]
MSRSTSSSTPTALVVGGTSGTGLATARLLAGRGDTVHVTGRTAARVEALAASDPGLTAHAADAADADRMAGVGDAVGTIDRLVLASSGGDGAGPLADLDLAVLRGAFEAKLWGQLTSLRTLLPRLAPDASVTFVSAISARAALPGTAGLAAVNGAIEAMVRPLAVELAPRRVNAVSPGVVDTPWWSALPEDARRAYFEQVAAALPVRRVATAEDIAETVALAATNRNLTGTVLETDGGARLVGPLG